VTHRQRFLKILIICYAPLGIVAGIGAYAGTFWFYFSQTKYLSSANSPSGRYRALLLEEKDSAECKDDDKAILIERRAGIFKTGELPLFCVRDTNARDLDFQWSGPSELTIDCPNCEPGTFEYYNGKWGEFSFRLEH